MRKAGLAVLDRTPTLADMLATLDARLPAALDDRLTVHDNGKTFLPFTARRYARKAVTR